MTTSKERERADQSVSTRFTRIMNATTSPYGVFTDPPVVAILAGVGLIATLGALQVGASTNVVYTLAGLIVLPIAISLVMTIALMGSRKRVVDWIAAVPFPVENMNAVLNGLGEFLEVSFKDGGPAAAELNPELDKVHPDAFVTKVTPEEGVVETVEIRIGVVDSKRNPALSNHERYKRVRAIVDQVLVPLSERRPIVEVRVK
jgi:hypothetical protein